MRHRRLRLVLSTALLLSAVSTGVASAGEIVPAVKPCGTPVPVNTLGPVFYDLGTGEQGGVPDPIPNPDTRWDVVLPTAGNAFSITPHPAWTTVTNANWINSRTTYASSGTPPTYNTTLQLPEGGTVTVAAGDVTTVFSTTFTLVPEVVNRVLNAEFAADNGARFYLNGSFIGGYNPPASATNATQLAAFKQLHPLTYAGPLLQDGLNTFTAVVSDRGVATGLLVRGGVDGCAVRGVTPTTCVDYKPGGGTTGGGTVVTYSPAPIDLGTGEQGYVPDPIGSIDTKWRTGPLGNGNAFSVLPYGTNVWYDDSTTGNWISVAQNRMPGAGVYTYRLDFTVPADISYGGLLFQYAADNNVAFTLNGTPVGSATNAFSTLHTVSVPSAPLVPGVNTLLATVTDFGVVSGLYVEGGAFVCRKPAVVKEVLDPTVGS